MCGIAAIFAYHKDARPVEQEELLRMREHMKTRGPDGSGIWIPKNRKIGLAHRRLSIIDLSEAGAQPMIDPDTGNSIVFNGEIYNYRELRKGLESKGYHFKSSSDTEVLLHLYADKGPDMVQDLRGMYAFAIFDPGTPRTSNLGPRTTNRCPGLFLARDPFGIKPLYIHDDGKTIRLASQVKALLAGGKILKEIEPAGHAGFFLWGHVPEPYTMYKNIFAFEPGTTLWIDNQGKRLQQQFCSIRDELAKASNIDNKLTSEDARKVLRESLLDTVRAHLVADVPIGFFLSSGLDSTTLVALASEVGADLRTVTLGFEEYKGTQNDEVPLAEEVAKQYGAKHQTVWVTKDDFRTEYDTMLDAMDQPTIDGVNSYFVSMAARKAGLKVVLSGLGGDELFGGYPSFVQIPKSVKALGWTNYVHGFGVGLRKVFAPLVMRSASPKYASLLEYGGSFGGAYLLRRGLMMPWELKQVMDTGMARDGLSELQTLTRLSDTEKPIVSAYGKVSALESTWYMRNQLLRDVDWASMSQSLEIRVPLVDLSLLRAVTPLIGQLGLPAKQAMARTPIHRLPESIYNRPKSGFGVPTREWLLPLGASRGMGSREWAQRVYKYYENT